MGNELAGSTVLVFGATGNVSHGAVHASWRQVGLTRGPATHGASTRRVVEALDLDEVAIRVTQCR